MELTLTLNVTECLDERLEKAAPSSGSYWEKATAAEYKPTSPKERAAIEQLIGRG